MIGYVRKTAIAASCVVPRRVKAS